MLYIEPIRSLQNSGTKKTLHDTVTENVIKNNNNDENKRAIEINLVTSTNTLLDERKNSENDQLVSLAKL